MIKDSTLWLIVGVIYGIMHGVELIIDGTEADYWGTLILAFVAVGFSRVLYRLGD